MHEHNLSTFARLLELVSYLLSVALDVHGFNGFCMTRFLRAFTGIIDMCAMLVQIWSCNQKGDGITSSVEATTWEFPKQFDAKYARLLHGLLHFSECLHVQRTSVW